MSVILPHNHSRVFSAISLSLLLALSACKTSGTSDVLSSAAKQKKLDEQTVDLRAYCPKIRIRAGTETMRIYAKGVKKNSPDAAKKLRFQATIQESVRECNYIAQTLAMRIGVAGRVINGPTGDTGKLELPIRVAVTRGDEVLYSKLHKISVDVTADDRPASFRFVDEAVNIDKPTSENIQIQVGFDEGPYDTP